MTLSVADSDRVDLGDISLNLARGFLTKPGIAVGRLRPTHSKLLAAFMRAPEGWLTHHDAFLALYDDRSEEKVPDPKIMHVHICRLRKEVDRFGLSIVKDYGRGYQLMAVKP